MAVEFCYRLSCLLGLAGTADLPRKARRASPLLPERVPTRKGAVAWAFHNYGLGMMSTNEERRPYNQAKGAGSPTKQRHAPA